MPAPSPPQQVTAKPELRSCTAVSSCCAPAHTLCQWIAIYPHSGHVVLGGTAQPGNWDRDPDPATGHAILERCTRLEPRLADAQVISHLVGLRPTRPHVRVDLENHRSGAAIAHNYDHGGAGVSLSWGCASEITRLISTPTSPSP